MKLDKKKIIIITGGFFLLDQILKWQALHAWAQAKLINPLVGWEPFLNPGVAFGLPFPRYLIIPFTLTIMFVVIYFATKLNKNNHLRYAGSMLILWGALSNLIDRIFYHYTIDYFRLLTGIINLADVMIVIGFLLFIGLENIAAFDV